MFVLKLRWKALIAALAAPLLIGAISALLTRESMRDFEALQKPPLTPPGWVFPVVWTILFLCMGIASYLASASGQRSRTALSVYAVQLAFNFLWPLLFFRFQLYLPAFIWLIMLWILILATLLLFRKISRAAGWLMLPYLLWVAFAGYLNYAVFRLN